MHRYGYLLGAILGPLVCMGSVCAMLIGIIVEYIVPGFNSEVCADPSSRNNLILYLVGYVVLLEMIIAIACLLWYTKIKEWRATYITHSKTPTERTPILDTV